MRYMIYIDYLYGVYDLGFKNCNHVHLVIVPAIIFQSIMHLQSYTVFSS